MKTSLFLSTIVSLSSLFSHSFTSTAAAAQSDEEKSPSDTIPTFLNNEEDRASDYANYFSAYAALYHQKIMLEDKNRMKAYHDAIMENKDLFKDKVVMDVGTGSSILATWAAQAGAKRVYAVEYTNMAHHAQSIVEANGVNHIVKVIQSAVEDVQLPLPDDDLSLFCGELDDDDDNADAKECKENEQVVDIIVSEWMGYFLLRESMLDSVIYARDRFLKPKTGLLFPSHATMLMAPVATEKTRKEAVKSYSDAMISWEEYLAHAQKEYGVDMTILNDKFEKEQNDYYLRSGHWLQLGPDSVLDAPTVVKELDMATCTLEDAKGVDSVQFQFNATKSTDLDEDQFISGLAGWFTVDFQSRSDKIGMTYAPKVKNPAHLSTGPEAGGEYAMVFLVDSQLACSFSSLFLQLLTGGSKSFTFHPLSQCLRALFKLTVRWK